MIRTAHESDLPALKNLQSAAPEAAQWLPDADALSHCLVAEIDGSPEAFLLYLPIPPDEAEILNLVVCPAHRRKGLATALYQELKAKIPGSIFLEVRASNAAARSLYQSLGFEVTAVRPAYYHQPVEDACVMIRPSD